MLLTLATTGSSLQLRFLGINSHRSRLSPLRAARTRPPAPQSYRSAVAACCAIIRGMERADLPHAVREQTLRVLKLLAAAQRPREKAEEQAASLDDIADAEEALGVASA